MRRTPSPSAPPAATPPLAAAALSLVLAPHAAPVGTVTCSMCTLRDDNAVVLALGRDDGTISVWTLVADRQPTLRTIRSSSGSRIVAVFVSQTKASDKPALGSLSQDGSLAMHSLYSGVTLCSMANRITTVGSPTAVASMRGGRLLGIAGHSASIHVLDTHADASTHLFSGHHDWVTCLCSFDSGTDSTLFSFSDDGMLGVWRWRNGAFEGAQRLWLAWPSVPLTALFNGATPMMSASAHDQVAIVTRSGRCGFVTLRADDSSKGVLPAHPVVESAPAMGCWAVAPSRYCAAEPTGSRLCSASDAGAVSAWPHSALASVKTCGHCAHGCRVQRVVLLAGELVVHAALSCAADVFASSDAVLVRKEHAASLYPDVYVLHDRLLIGGFPGGARAALLPGVPAKPESGLQARVTVMKVVGGWLVVGMDSGLVTAHAAEETLGLQAEVRAHVGPVTAIADGGGSDGKARVCTAGADGDVVLFALPQLVCLLRLVGHVGGVRSVSVEGGFIKVISDVTHYWNIKSGALERLAANSSTMPPGKRLGATMLLQLPMSLEAGAMENQDPRSASCRPRIARPVPLALTLTSVDWALGLVHEWGLDAAMDAAVAAVSPRFGLGVEFALESPQQQGGWTVHTAQRWQDSAEMCAAHSLNLVSMLLAASSANETMKELATFIGLVLPSALRLAKQWTEPDLALFARCSVSEGSGGGTYVAARLLLQSTVERMPSAQRKRVVAVYAQRIAQLAEAAPAWPRTAGGASAAAASHAEMDDGGGDALDAEEPRPHLLAPDYQLAALLLGVVGLSFPQDITPAVARMVCDGLVEAIFSSGTAGGGGGGGGGGGSKFAFPSGTPPLSRKHAAALATSGGAPASHVAWGHVVSVAFASELVARGFALFRPHLHSLSRLVRCLIALTAEDETTLAAAQRALAEVAAVHPVMLIRAVGSEALRRDVADAHRVRALNSLTGLVAKSPALFLRQLPLIVEVVIKTLDPSDPALRQACLQASTRTLHELVKRFPMVGFHQASQRFAVGTVESAILVYDLRTATKWRILEGSEGPISALAFDKSGERLCSFCASEAAVRFWKAGSAGLMGGLLGIRGKAVARVAVDASSREEGRWRVDWAAPEQITLRREGESKVLAVNAPVQGY